MLNSIFNNKETAIPISEEYRTNSKHLIDTEIKAIFEDEIRNAARELIEEQRKAIQVVIEEHKQVLREVVEEKKLTFLLEKEKSTIQKIANKPEGMAQFRQGDRVKLFLLDTDSKPKDDLAQKCLTYNGQPGNITFMSPALVNSKSTFIYYVRIDKDKKILLLTEDCLKPA